MLSEPEFRNRKARSRDPVRILLVEDDPHFAELLRMQLRRLPTLDARLEVVDTLAAATQKLATESFGLVLTDLNLPDSSGLATVEALSRAGEQLVIVLTGADGHRLRAGAFEAGAFDFLSKDQLSAAALERVVRLAAMQANSYRSLRDNEARLRSLLELSSDVYWEQDEEFRFTSFTECRSARNEGLGTRVMIGRRRWDTPYTNLSPADWKAHIALLEAHRPFHDLELCRLQDGREMWISTSGEPVFDAAGEFQGYRGVATDITARKLAEKAMREGEARFRSLTELSSDWYWEQDAELRFVSTGGSSEARGGITPQAHTGKRRWELPGTAIVGQTWEEHKAVCLAHRPFRDVVLRRTADDGQIRYVSVAGSPVLDAQGAFCGYRGTARDITDRMLAEQGLRESETRLRQTFELAASGIAHVDMNGRFLRLNPCLCQMLGYSQEELVGRSVKDISHPDDRNVTDTQRARVHAGELDSASFEKRYLRKDGSEVWVSLTIALARDDVGKPQYEIAVLEDITERKRDERARQVEHAITQCLAEAESLSGGLREVMHAICEIQGWDCGRYFSADEEAGVLRLAEAWATPGSAADAAIEAARHVTYARGIGVAGHVWSSAAPMWVADIQADPRAARAVFTTESGMHGALSFPVTSGGQVIGVLGFNAREVRQPDDRLLQAVSVIGSQIGQFVKRKEAEGVLRESETRFRDLVDLSSDFYWETDAEHRIIQTSHNSRHQPVVGARQAGLTRWDTPSTWPDATGWAAHRAMVEAHQPIRDFEFARLDKDGVERHLSISGEPVFDAGGTFLGYRGVGRDITARKREEQVLRLEHLVARVLSEAEDWAAGVRGVMRAVCETESWECGRFFAWDESAGLLRFQDSWAISDPVVEHFVAESRALTFLPGKGIAGRVWQAREPLWSSDTANDPRTQVPALSARSGVRGLFSFPILSERGCLGVLSFASRTVREPDERLLRSTRVIGSQLGQFLQHREAQSALSESEARHRQTFELAGSGMAHVGNDRRFVRVNRRLCEILGYPPEELIGRPGKDFSHPDDLNTINAQRPRLYAGEVPTFQIEKRYLRKDGSTVWVTVTVALVYDATGRPLHEIHVVDDISARKNAESVLHRFRTALDQSADMVLLVDSRDAKLLDFNDTACAYLGYERAELLGKPSELIVAGMSTDELRASHQQLLAAAGRADSLVRTYRRKDGTTFEVEVLRRVIDSPEGSILVINARDLTERRALEARQAAYLRYQERVARFGQSALAKREPAELVAKAVQAVLEALVADAVAYLEPTGDADGLTVREIAGALQPESGASCELVAPFVQVLRTANRCVVDGAELPLPWAQGMRSVALVPVRGEGGVRGILCACYERAGAFGAEELNFAEAAASVLSAGLQRIDSEARLAYLAQFDALTGLPNRALLADRFSQMIVRAQRHDRSLGVLFIDLDEFKMVNDTLGHAGGDALLKEVSVRLQAAVRPGDTVARISGDEFAVVLADLAQPEDAALVAQKVLDRLAAPVDVLGSEAFITASVGISVFPGDGQDAEALLGAADAAMYRAKQSGRNAYQFFTAEITQRTRARAQLGSELRRALERGDFALMYQPKFSLETRRPYGAEALLRWKHPERGMVSPAEFIPVLEETGLIVPVGEWVLRRACADIKAWRAAGIDVGPVAINLSARQFRQSDLDARITTLIAESGVEAAAIELEITESQLMHDPEHAIRVMRSLQQAGIRLAIDDFGTGYSSLAYLTRFPVVSLKIDRSFVADVYNDPSAAAIVRTIIEMAHTLGFSVVAEGVETEDQAKFLRLLRCEQAQGYLFARPMPAAELSALISSATTGGSGN